MGIEKEPFSDVLREYVNRLNLSSGRIAQLSDLPKDTVVSWVQGRVKRPRNVIDILKIARALRLTNVETNRLLQSANHGDLANQVERAQSKQNQATVDILGFWLGEQVAETNGFAKSTRSLIAPFQARPQPVTFVGRGFEIDSIKQGLALGGHVCLIRGLGGVGKTTLATHLAYELRETFPDGVLWADFGDEQPTEDQILRTLGNFAEAYGRDVREAEEIEARSQIVRNLFANKRVLIILDNVYGSETARPFLPPTTGHSSVIITTRNKKMMANQPLVFDLEPFDAGEGMVLLQALVGESRVQAEAETAGKIVEFVAGLPLALRIVGTALAETDTLSLAEYASLLEDQRSTLDTLLDWEDATKNVRASITVSYNRLNAFSKSLFNVISVFPSNEFSLEALLDLSDANPILTKQNLSRLTSLSLLDSYQAEVSQKQLTRFRIHPLLKLFAEEQLSEPTTEPQRRLVAHYSDYVAQYAADGIPEIDLEWANIQGGLQHALDIEAWATFQQTLHKLTDAHLGIVGYMDAKGYWREALDWLKQLEEAPTLNKKIVEKGLLAFKQGAFQFHLGRAETAETLLSESINLLETADLEDEDAIAYAYACEFMSNVALRQGIEEALEWSQQGIEILDKHQSVRSQQEKGWLMIRQGGLWARLGSLKQGRATIQAGLDALPEKPSPARMSAMMNLGNIAFIQGQLEQARQFWERALAEDVIGDSRRKVNLEMNMASLNSLSGDILQAVERLKNVRLITQETGNLASECLVSSNMAYELMKLDQDEAAIEVLNGTIERSDVEQLPEVTLLHINRAKAHLKTDDLEKAQTDIDFAEVNNRTFPQARWQGMILQAKAEVALKQESLTEALAHIDRALLTNSDDEEMGIAWRIRGNVLSELKQWDEAEQAYQKSLELFGEDNPYEVAMTRVDLGRAYISRQNTTAAQQELDAATATFIQHQLPSKIARIEQLPI